MTLLRNMVNEQLKKQFTYENPVRSEALSALDEMPHVKRAVMDRGAKVTPAASNPVEPVALPEKQQYVEAVKPQVVQQQQQAQQEAQAKAEQEAQAKAQAQQQAGVYSQMYQRIFGNKEPETEEQRKKREKREKATMTIANLSDALANVANIWGTSKGALSVDLSSMSDTTRKRYDYLKQQRERNEDAYLRGLYQAMNSDMQESRQQARHQAQQDQRDREHLYKIWKDDRDNEYKIKQDEAKAKFENDKFEEQKKLNEANIEAKKQATAANWARTNAYAKNLASKAASQKTAGGQDVKVLQFAMSDGTGISVPKMYEKDYYADVYDVLAAAVDKPENQEIKKVIDVNMLKHNTLGMVSRGTQQRDAVHALAKHFPEVEQYMKDRAGQLWAGIGQQPSEANIIPVAPDADENEAAINSGGDTEDAQPEDATQDTTSYPNQQEIAVEEETPEPEEEYDEIDDLLQELIPNM